MVCVLANSFPVPPLIYSQITTSRQYSRERFPATSMRLSSWRKPLDKMLLSPKLNALFSHWHTAMLTLCGFTNGIKEASGAAGRKHDNVTARTSIDNIQQNLEGAWAHTVYRLKTRMKKWECPQKPGACTMVAIIFLMGCHYFLMGR